jgi:hypothetical protein
MRRPADPPVSAAAAPHTPAVSLARHNDAPRTAPIGVPIETFVLPGYTFIFCVHNHIHTYHSRFIPEGVTEATRIILQDAHVLPKLFSYK